MNVGHFIFPPGPGHSGRLSPRHASGAAPAGQRARPPEKNHSSAPNLRDFRGLFCNPRPRRKEERSAYAVAPESAQAFCGRSKQMQVLASSLREVEERICTQPPKDQSLL